MKRAARWTLIVSGSLSLMIGLLVWPADAAPLTLLGLHELLGYVVVVSLWLLAGLSVRAGVATGRVVAAVAWSLVTLLVATTQKLLVPGDWHWTIRGLHLVTGAGMIAWGELLAAAMREREAAASGRPTIAAAAAEFLACKRIAITGVSRTHADHGSNVVYHRLRERGYQVFAVNPNTDELAGDRCYHDLASIPGGVDAVLIGTRAEHAPATMRACADLGITQVWMHRSVGPGSVSDEATAWGRAHGIHVIDGGCPLMFPPVSDPGHRVMRSVLTLTHKVPRRV
jgi:predicted CoA-binding protein